MLWVMASWPCNVSEHCTKHKSLTGTLSLFHSTKWLMICGTISQTRNECTLLNFNWFEKEREKGPRAIAELWIWNFAICILNLLQHISSSCHIEGTSRMCCSTHCLKVGTLLLLHPAPKAKWNIQSLDHWSRAFGHFRSLSKQILFLFHSRIKMVLSCSWGHPFLALLSDIHMAFRLFTSG